jgi:hypothetical protein
MYVLEDEEKYIMVTFIFCLFSSDIRLIKWRRMRWEGYIVSMGCDKVV